MAGESLTSASSLWGPDSASDRRPSGSYFPRLHCHLSIHQAPLSLRLRLGRADLVKIWTTGLTCTWPASNNISNLKHIHTHTHTHTNDLRHTGVMRSLLTIKSVLFTTIPMENLQTYCLKKLPWQPNLGWCIKSPRVHKNTHNQITDLQCLKIQFEPLTWQWEHAQMWIQSSQACNVKRMNSRVFLCFYVISRGCW